jgi:type I restriction enzyme S subunit
MPIGAVCELFNGRAFKPTDWTVDGFPIVRIQNLNDISKPFNRFSGQVDSRHLIDSGDLLFAWSGTPGTSFGAHIWNGGPAVLNQHIFRVFPRVGLVGKEYLRYAINAVLGQLIASAHGGAGLAHVTKPVFEATRIHVPELVIQSSIVAHLDACFDRTKRAKAALDDVPALVDRLRQSILATAFRGDLTADWRAENPDVEPASELLKRIRIERRRRWEEAELAKMIAKGKAPKDDRWKAKYEEPEPVDESGLPELPEGWCWTTIETAGDVHLGRQLAPQYMTGRGTRPYLRVANIKDDRIDFSDVKWMDFDEQEFAHYALRPNDILLSEGQSPELLGQSAIYRGGVEELCFQKTLHRFRRYESAPSAEFFQLLFRHYVRSGMFRSVASVTVNIAHLTLVRLKPLPIPLPPAAEAEEIAKRCAAVLGYARTAQQNVVAVRRELASVEAAVLGGAFASATDFAES